MADVRPFVNRHRSGVTFAALVVSSLVLVGLFPAPGQVGLLSLLQAGIGSVSRWVGDTVNSIDELRRSRAEVQELRAQIARMEQRLRDQVELEVEIRELRALVDLDQTVAVHSIPAAVIARDPGNLFETVTINRGRRHGVRRDAPVVASADGLQALVGRVAWAGPLTAVVQPVLDSAFVVTARLQRTRHDGLVVGDPAAGGLVMRYVPLGARDEVAAGDLVITSGLIPDPRIAPARGRPSLYPRGIYIGRVQAAGPGEHGDSIELTVVPLVSFDRLDFVIVLTVPEPPDG